MWAYSTALLKATMNKPLDIITGQEPATLRALVREEPLPSPQHRILMIAGYYGTKAPASQGHTTPSEGKHEVRQEGNSFL